MRKNLSGQGSTRERPDGRWEVRWYTVENGKRRRHSAYRKTAGEARMLLAEKTQKRDLGVPEPKALSGRLTVQQWLERWLQDRQGSLRPAGWESYAKIVRSNLVPEIGKLKLRQLTHRDLDAMYARMARRLAPSTIKGIHGVLRLALRAARREGLIVLDPSELMRRLPAGESFHHGLTADEMDRMLETSSGGPWGTVFAVALWGGLRFGEVAALHWHDVDFEKRTVRVDKGLSKVTQQTADTLGLKERRFLQAPKTRKSRRAVLLPQEVMDRLAKDRKAQIDRYLAAPDRTWNEDVLVFESEHFNPLDRATANRRWHECQTAIGISREHQVRLHDARRTAATLGSGGGPQRDMVDRLGHAADKMTLHYQDAQSQEGIVRHMEAQIAAARAKRLREAQ